MKYLIVGITALLCAAATAAAQTPVQTLSHIGHAATLQTPPHIVVAPDGSSIVAWPEGWLYFDAGGIAGAPVREEVPLLGVHALDTGRWAFLSVRDSSWSGPEHIFTRQYWYYRLVDPYTEIGKTDTILTLLNAGSSTDAPSSWESLDFLQCAKFEGTLLLAATLSFQIVQYIGPGVEWQEQRWGLWHPGEQVKLHAPAIARRKTVDCHTDIMLGSFSESGIPFLLQRDQLEWSGNTKTYLRYRLDAADGSVLRIDTLRRVNASCPALMTQCIAHDDGALDVIETLPGSDTLLVRRFNGAGVEIDSIVLCEDVSILPGPSIGSSIPDASYLPVDGGRHLVCWTRKDAPDTTHVYISVFDENWQRIGEPHAVAGGAGVQLGAAIAQQDDSTVAVAWYEKNPGWKLNYRRIPLAQFVTPQPPVGVVLFTHIEDNTPLAELDAPEALAQYTRVREGLIAFAKKMSQHGLQWSLQPDWKFLLAALRFENGLLSPATKGKPLLTWLRDDMGMAVDPHSHENQGYNYTDVAHLLDSLGAGGSTVIGGHVWDPSLPQFQQWDRFRSPVRGSRFPWASWRGNILMGSATPNHVNDPLVSGVWRPEDRWHFFDDDPAGNIACVGQYRGDMDGVHELVPLRRSGAVPPDSILTTSLHIPLSRLLLPAELNVVEDSILTPLARMRNRGDILVTDFTSLVDTWRESYASAPNVYRPGISTDIDPEAHAIPRSAILDMYPNPVRDFLTVRYVLPPGVTARLVLYDLLGRRLHAIPVSGGEMQTVTLSLTDRRPGLYFIRLHSADGVITRRIVLLR